MGKIRWAHLGKTLRNRWIAAAALILAAAALAVSVTAVLKILVPQWAFDRSLFDRNRPAQTSGPLFPEWKGLSLGELVAAPTPVPTDQPYVPPADYDFSKNRINILVLGLDSSDERVAAGMNFRSDTIILVSVNFTDGTVDMLSVPRDTYTKIYNKDTRNKINSAFMFGGGTKGRGFEYASKTVSAFLGGIPIDFYVGFDMNVVKKTIDIMGGVWYEVDISFTMAGRPMQTGYQLLSGQQVLDYCRWRYTAGGDIGRIDRQQRMLTTIFQQLKSTRQIKNIPDILSAVSEGLYTNLEPVQIAALGNFMMDLGIGNIRRHTVEGQSMMLGDVSYYVIYQEKKKQLIQDIFGVTITYDPEEDVDFVLQELERNRKELESSISDSLALQQAVGAMLASSDAAYLTPSEKTLLNSGIARCADAVDMQTKELIDTETAKLRGDYNNIKSQINSRKSLRSQAASALEKAREGMAAYESCMEPGDKTSVSNAMEDLGSAVDEGNYDVMQSRTEQLETVSEPVFNRCRTLLEARQALEKTLDTADDMTERHEGLYIEDRADLETLAGQARAMLAGYDAGAIADKNRQLGGFAYECLDRFIDALEEVLDGWTLSEEELDRAETIMHQLDTARLKQDGLDETAQKTEELYELMKEIRPSWEMDLHKPEPTPKP